jgi:hypothetical protein
MNKFKNIKKSHKIQSKPCIKKNYISRKIRERIFFIRINLMDLTIFHNQQNNDALF